MANSWSNTAIRSLTIPTDAGDGARITINEDNDGAILMYDENGVLVASLSPLAGTAADGSTYIAGLELLTDPGGGTLEFQFNPGRATSPLIVLNPNVAGLGTSLIKATTDVGETTGFLDVQGPTNAGDSEGSFAQMLMASSPTGQNAGALIDLAIRNSVGAFANLLLSSTGATASGTFGGPTGPTLNGRVVQTDQTGDTEPGCLHWGFYSGTVGAGGLWTISHGCNFTPTFALMTGVLNFSQGFFSSTFTATTAVFAAFLTNGSPVPNGTTVSGFGMFGI